MMEIEQATKKEQLMDFFGIIKHCRNIKSFTVIVTTPGCSVPEEITNPIENLSVKSEFYNKAYTDDLVHAMNDKVKIIGWHSNNYPNDIEEDETGSFSWALELLKQGKKVTRKDWQRGRKIYCEIQFPDEHSEMTKPYIFMTKDDHKFPSDLSCESIMANDWEVVE